VSSPLQTSGLRFDQAPPLAIPAAFFVTAPLAAFAAGVLLLVRGSSLLMSGWLPQTLAFTHLGTLGFLAMVMFGALYQVTPVIAGCPVPRVRSGLAVHALLVVGVVGLVASLLAVRSGLAFVSIAVLAVVLLLFVLPVGLALLRAPTRNETVTGMRMALASLLIVSVLGLWMAHGHAGMRFPGPRDLWIQVHLGVGFLGWIGCLISAVSWQVLPMFYVTPHFSRWSKRTTLALVALGVLLPVVVLFLDLLGDLPETWPRPGTLAAAGALPAAIAVWCLQPALALRSLSRRRRRRLDGSAMFWQAGLCSAFFAAAAAAAALALPQPRWSLLLGWIAIWGWAGMIVHGMSTRIVPFLVWFHRFSHVAGRVPVPSLRGLLPDAWTRLGLALHGASLLAGAVAIASGLDLLARVTGLLLMATAAQLEHSLIHVLRQHPQIGASESSLAPETARQA
jgi:hypothetical protein